MYYFDYKAFDKMHVLDDNTIDFIRCLNNNRPFSASPDEISEIIANIRFAMTINEENSKDFELLLLESINYSIKIFPENPIFRVWQLRYYFILHQFETAKDYFHKIIEEFPKSYELYGEMAVAAFELKLRDFDVIKLCNMSIALNPTWFMYFLKVKYYLSNNDIDAAVDSFVNAVELDEIIFDELESMIHEALESLENLNPDESDKSNDSRRQIYLDFLKRLIEIYPLEHSVWFVYGLINFIYDDLDVALEAALFAYSIEQKDNITSLLCQIYFAMDDFDKTIEYGLILNKTSEFFSANVNIAASYRHKHDYDSAIRYLAKITDTDISYPNALSEIVCTLEESGRGDEVEYYFNKFYNDADMPLFMISLVAEKFCNQEREDLFYKILDLARKKFDDDLEYCRWLTVFSIDLKLSGFFVPIDIIGDVYDVTPFNHDNFSRINYYYSAMCLLLDDSENGEKYLQTALILGKEHVYEDFFDLGARDLCEKFDNIIALLSKFL